MGVPKFYRWLSERYPKINQRVTFEPDPERHRAFFEKQQQENESTNDDDDVISNESSYSLPQIPRQEPDPLSTCSMRPPIDRLYIDMNGVIHGCSHSDESSANHSRTEEDIFKSICYYLERLIDEIAQPSQLVYLAIDGVAPRAKLNQQRSRRYRGGTDELEQSIYDEFGGINSQKEQQQGQQQQSGKDSSEAAGGDSKRRLTGKFQQVEGEDQNNDNNKTDNNDVTTTTKDDQNTGENIIQQHQEQKFNPSAITPGTQFFDNCMKHLEHFIQSKMSNDWKHLNIILSGPQVPGEGEHKIMDFIRHERSKSDYDPNLRHCIVGQDADLIMLGLASHEPNMCLLRERILFGLQKQQLLLYYDQMEDEDGMGDGIDAYLLNPHFEFLHLRILRDYLMYEFGTKPAVPQSRYELERVIDDFIFLTFFVGNDFLPHMPALDIGDEAFDLLFFIYKKKRKNWRKKSSKGGPYLTHSGNIACGRRLESFLQALGSHEVAYYDNKRENADTEKARIRKQTAKFGFESTLPTDEVLQLTEESARAKYREMMHRRLLQSEEEEKDDEDEEEEEEEDEDEDDANDEATSQHINGFRPVLTSKAPEVLSQGTTFTEEEDDLSEGFLERMGSILNYSITSNSDGDDSTAADASHSFQAVDDQDIKGRYYFDKFQFTPFDADKHLDLRKKYIEGLVWNLKYYYHGCVSWEWYYPYHYGPMMSDLHGIEKMLQEIEMEMGQPLKPFEQLMGCLPPSSANLLPEPYRWLMTDEASPISDFYPKSFTVDMNGKLWPWEAVALLPFIQSDRLLTAAREHVTESMLTEEERKRNTFKTAQVYTHDYDANHSLPALGDGIFGEIQDYRVKVEDIEATEWNHSNHSAILEPVLKPGLNSYTPGYPSLTTAPIKSIQRRHIGNNVFGSRSRYRTSILSSEGIPVVPPMDALAQEFIGSTIYINYPYLMESFVTAISNSQYTIRGTTSDGTPRRWTPNEAEVWEHTLKKTSKSLTHGEALPGTGGWDLPDSEIMFSVRPFQKVITLPNGTMAKTYAKFEIQVPFLAAIWSPPLPDPRLADLPMALERDAYFLKTQQKQQPILPRSKAMPFHQSNSSQRLMSTMPAARLSHRGAARLGKRGGQSFSTTAMHRHRAVGGVRTRALALGIAAVAAFSQFSTTTSIHLQRHPWSIPRGGGDAFLPDQPSPPPLEFAHGTTTLSFVFQGGIIVAVDSRATIGNYVGSKTVEKVLPINSHCLGTMAGGAADCSFWIRQIAAEAKLHELERDGQRMTATRASRLLSNVLYDYRGIGLSMGTMIMGVDDVHGPSIYYVDDTGMRLRGPMFSAGSGSTFALGILDQEHSHDMTEEEAIALGIKAIRHATFRDAFSGGFINVYLITKKDGWRRVFRDDLAKKQSIFDDR